MTTQALKQARKRRHHTQEQAAREIGVSWVTVARWESGVHKPAGLQRDALTRYLESACARKT